mgnify:CR=1 FL=1
MAVMETLHNTVPEESRIYVVFVLVILWDVRLNVGAKLIDGEAYLKELQHDYENMISGMSAIFDSLEKGDTHE